MTVVVADIHGRKDLLDAILEKYPDEDYLFLGDLVDRGPDTPGVVEKVRELVLDNRAILCLGNHEDMMIRGVKYQKSMYFTCWYTSGGNVTAAQYQDLDDPAMFKEHVDFIEANAYQWYVLDTPNGKLLCVHASPPHPAVYAWADDAEKARVLIRHYDDHLWTGVGALQHPLPSNVQFSAHGHIPRRKPVWKGPHALLDLGSFESGHVGILNTNTMEMESISVKKEQQ